MIHGNLLILLCLALVCVVAGASALWRRFRYRRRLAAGWTPPGPEAPLRAMETLGQATERLTREGFRDSFRPEGKRLHALGADRSYRPEDLRVEACVRFEGESDPADECVIFALQADDGVRGTFVSSFGPGVDAAVADIVPRLARAERAHAAAERAAEAVGH